MGKKIKGYTPNFVINDEVSGNDMIRVHQKIGKLGGQVNKAAERLMVFWTAEEIVRSAVRAPGCQCPNLAADIRVHPDVAYNLARKSPAKEAAQAGVTNIASQYGGVIPLYTLSKVLGPWDSLIEELIPRRRG
jgi:hypothetical protein